MSHFRRQPNRSKWLSYAGVFIATACFLCLPFSSYGLRLLPISLSAVSQKKPEASYVPGEILVRFREGLESDKGGGKALTVAAGGRSLSISIDAITTGAEIVKGLRVRTDYAIHHRFSRDNDTGAIRRQIE